MLESVQTYDEKQALINAWVSFLSRLCSWDAWFTMTFANPAMSSILAIDRAQRLLKDFYKSAGMGRPQAFIVAEGHRDGGSYHTHGLLRVNALDPTMEKMVLDGLWNQARQRFGLSKFSVIRDPDATVSYCSKYMSKTIADHRFLGHFNRVEAGATV